MRVRQLRLLAGWLISLVFALLAVRGVDWSGTWASLRGAKLLPLAAAGVLTIILQGLRATRWGVLLLSLRAGASWGRLFAAVNIGYFFNNILPFRAGDFVRVHLWGKWTDTSRMGVLSTVALERVVDLFCVALLVPVLLRIVVLPRWATWAGTAAGVVSVLAIAGFGCALFYERPIVRVAEWRHEQSPLLRRMGVRQKVGSLLAGLEVLRHARQNMRVLLLSGLMWTGQVACVQLVLLALSIRPSPASAMAVIIFASLGLAIPSAPGGVGVYHYAVILALVFRVMAWHLPVALERTTSTLGGAAIPSMLILLGLQLQRNQRTHQVPAMILSNGMRLVGGAAFGLLLGTIFGLQGVAFQAGVVEAATPTAVLATVLSTEFDIEPAFVTSVVFTTTLLSPLTLTPLLAYLGA